MVSEDIQSLLDSLLVQRYPHNTEGVALCLVNHQENIKKSLKAKTQESRQPGALPELM